MKRVGMVLGLLVLCAAVGVAIGKAGETRLSLTFSCWANEAPVVKTNAIGDHQVTAAVSNAEAKKIIESLMQQLSDSGWEGVITVPKKWAKE